MMKELLQIQGANKERPLGTPPPLPASEREALARVAYFGGLRAVLSRLPAKLVEIDGAALRDERRLLEERLLG